MTRRKVLVVDDHVALAENIAEILEDAGYDAAIAASAEEAMARASDPSLVAIVTDYRLPGLSGAELISALRKAGNPLPAIVMSAHTDAATVTAAEDAGASDVFAKPLDITRLVSSLRGLAEEGGEILIVEDNRSLAENLAEVLAATGLRPVVSDSADGALDHKPRPRAAVIDFRLPDRSGVDVARRLAARDPGVRVLFISGYPEELRSQLQREGMHAAVLPKPLDMAKLVAWARGIEGHGAAHPRR